MYLYLNGVASSIVYEEYDAPLLASEHSRNILSCHLNRTHEIRHGNCLSDENLCMYLKASITNTGNDTFIVCSLSIAECRAD